MRKGFPEIVLSVDDFTSQFQHKTVPRELREKILTKYPDLMTDRNFLAFFAYVLFEPQKDKDSNGIVVCAKTLARIEGKVSRFKNGNYNSMSFLERIRTNHDLCMKVSDYRYAEHRCRVLTDCEFREIEDEYINGLHDKFINDKDHVYFFSGKKFLSPNYKYVHLGYNDENHPAYFIIKYLNELPSNAFSGILKRNIERILAAIDALPQKTEHDRGLRNHIIRSIDCIINENPKLHYRITDILHPRIFAEHYSLQNINSYFRRIMTKGWIEYDLVSSQLAIISKTWGAHKMNEWLLSHLNTDIKIWDKLICDIGIDSYNDEYKTLKSSIKEFVYSLCYGMSEKNLKDIFVINMSNIIDNPLKSVKLLMKHELIKDVLEARRKYSKEIEAKGYDIDAFGRSIPITNYRKITSVLAIVAQSVELHIIIPAFEYAIANRDKMTIQLFQHDGFSVRYIKYSKKLERGLIEAVDGRARELGIATRLEKA